jgi:hypothetical protein
MPGGEFCHETPGRAQFAKFQFLNTTLPFLKPGIARNGREYGGKRLQNPRFGAVKG